MYSGALVSEALLSVSTHRYRRGGELLRDGGLPPGRRHTEDLHQRATGAPAHLPALQRRRQLRRYAVGDLSLPRPHGNVFFGGNA